MSINEPQGKRVDTEPENFVHTYAHQTLWFLVVAVYGVLDLLTTDVAISMGAIEFNPFANWLLQYGFIALIIFKSIVIIYAYLIWIYLKYKAIPISLIILGSIVFINNSIMIIFIN
ncbi:MAG: DUF5658 family protein [Candidatus Hodarchaeales archaeon]|jgi:hypothetical protein